MHSSHPKNRESRVEKLKRKNRRIYQSSHGKLCFVFVEFKDESRWYIQNVKNNLIVPETNNPQMEWVACNSDCKQNFTVRINVLGALLRPATISSQRLHVKVWEPYSVAAMHSLTQVQNKSEQRFSPHWGLDSD